MVPIVRQHHDFEELKLLGERRRMTSFSPWYDEFDLPRKVLLGCVTLSGATQSNRIGVLR
jgi:hypothetical protein